MPEDGAVTPLNICSFGWVIPSGKLQHWCHLSKEGGVTWGSALGSSLSAVAESHYLCVPSTVFDGGKDLICDESYQTSEATGFTEVLLSIICYHTWSSHSNQVRNL
jgi:hypothetical protein